MKDKRQRMAMAWPYGIADPHLYAYIAAAAASYPYGLAAGSPFGCYSGVPMQRPQAALPQMLPNSGLRPNQDFLNSITNSFMRPPAIAVPHPVHSSPPIGCGIRSPLETASMLSHGASSAGSPSRVSNSAYSSAVNVSTSIATAHAQKRSSTAPNGLFRPFQSEVERT